jgi:hypothetical protein
MRVCDAVGLGRWIAFASAETLDKALREKTLRYLGATDEQTVDANRKNLLRIDWSKL